MVSMTFYLFYIKLPPSWPQFLQPRGLLKGLSAPFAASRHLRSKMGQDRLSSIAVINIERKCKQYNVG